MRSAPPPPLCTTSTTPGALQVGETESHHRQRGASVHDAQAEVAERAHDILRQIRRELLVYGYNGEIRSRHSYGHGADPPKSWTGSTDLDQTATRETRR